MNVSSSAATPVLRTSDSAYTRTAAPNRMSAWSTTWLPRSYRRPPISPGFPGLAPAARELGAPPLVAGLEAPYVTKFAVRDQASQGQEVAVPLAVADRALALAADAGVALRRRFSASEFLDDVRRYGATYFTYVGRAVQYLPATPERPDDRDNPLRAGSSPPPAR